MARIFLDDGSHTAYHTAALAAWDAMTEEDITSMTRAECIGWLEWNDHDGAFSDEDAAAEGFTPFTLEQARGMLWTVRSDQ